MGSRSSPQTEQARRFHRVVNLGAGGPIFARACRMVVVLDSLLESERLIMDMDPNSPIVGVVMGSKSDWETLGQTSEILSEWNVPHESRIVSAHRTPHRLFEYAQSAEHRGLEVIIAGAGGAAHLPGMIASLTILPVLGVPVESAALRGIDSLLSIVQMPRGIPVGTLAIGTSGAVNAALFAIAILARKYPHLRQQLVDYRRCQTENVHETPFDSAL